MTGSGLAKGKGVLLNRRAACFVVLLLSAYQLVDLKYERRLSLLPELPLGFARFVALGVRLKRSALPRACLPFM